jgi:hypothetical protein
MTYRMGQAWTFLLLDFAEVEKLQNNNNDGMMNVNVKSENTNNAIKKSENEKTDPSGRISSKRD